MSDAFQRWQDNSRRSLEYVNNILIALGSGLIAVALADANDPAKLAHLLPWQRAAAGTAVILLGLSILAGVATAANRLQSARLTARLTRIRDLRGRALPVPDTGPEWQYDRLKGIIRALAGPEHVTRRGVRSTACRVSAEPELTTKNVQDVVDALRGWTNRADTRTWRLIRAQLWLFLLGAVIFSAVPAWNYFRGV